MGFIKCPRCELNYIQEDEQYCPVCKREMKGEVKPLEGDAAIRKLMGGM